MRRPPRPRPCPKVLLVEGNDDLHVVANVCKVQGLPEKAFWIEDKQGYETLIAELATELDASELACLGILVDADIDAARRWAALRNRLIALGYDHAPQDPYPEGIVLAKEGKPNVGVWMMPDNTLPGMLEDFVAYLVPNDNSLWVRAQACVRQIPPDERPFSEHHLSKVHIHTWLAWQEEPGKPMGQAITATYLKPGAPQVTLFVEWMRRLFQI